MKGVRRLRWDAGRLAAERERRLRELLVYAADHSPFWRERLAGRDLANFTEADLPSLPILTKAEMMAEFDRMLTVPGLTRARVKEHLDQLDGDRYLDDEYRAIVTSGYAGTEASTSTAGTRSSPSSCRAPAGPGDAAKTRTRCWRSASVAAPGMNRGCFTPSAPSRAAGRHRTASMPRSPWTRSSTVSTTPVLRCRLSKGGRASSGSWLSEAMQGRLTIKPTWVSVAGELCTPPVREAVRSAWGIEASEFWGCSEGTYAFPCGVGEGMHVADDLVILEPADADGNVVPYGQPADRMLLTNLFNLEQPLIRYDLIDAVTMSDEPCPCGCAHRRITSVNGRINGAFEYEGGAVVPRAAFEQTVLATPGVANFFVGKTQGGVDVSVVTDGSSDLQRLRMELIDVLRRHGGPESDVGVQEVGSIERLSRGKSKQFDPEVI